jgi:hypothetical protein
VTQFFTALWAHHTELLADLGAVVLGATATLKALEVLAALLSNLFPGVAAFAQADGWLKVAIGWALALLDRLSVLPKLPKPAPKALMALALPLLMAGSLFIGGRADAQVMASSGPTIPLMQVRPGNPHPVSLAPGAGYQLSLTLPQFQRAIGGRAWDLLDFNLMAFGSAVSSASGETFGALSVAAGLCSLSSLVCLGLGHDVATAPGMRPGWFGLFALSINFAMAPEAPPVGVAQGAHGLTRANTLYFGAP